MNEKCCIKDCDNPVYVKSRKMCRTHYKRWYKYGNPTEIKKPYRHPNKICKVGGCNLPTDAKGLCDNHYHLMKRNGEPVRKRIFRFSYIKDGYRYVYTGKRHYEPEHRIVMERFLNRKLKSSENIHHIDENTLNNSPSNLMIVNRSEHMSIHIKIRKPQRITPLEIPRPIPLPE